MLGKENKSEKLKRVMDQKPTFGLRKLSMGLASVMLGVTFFLAGGNAAFADTLATSSAQTNATAPTNDSATVTTAVQPTVDAAKTSAAVTDSPVDSESAPATTTTANSSQRQATSATATDQLAPRLNLMAVTTLDTSAATALAVTDANGITLSINRATVGNDGADNAPLNIDLAGTFQRGEVYTIGVPVTTFGVDDSNFDSASIANRGVITKADRVENGQKYRYYTLSVNNSFTTTTGFKLVIADGNNYSGQPMATASNAIDPAGAVKREIKWGYQDPAAGSVANQSLFFTTVIKSAMHPRLTQVKPDAKSVTQLQTNTTYDFELDINQVTGLQNDTSYSANQVNSAVNLGTTITIPVPGEFVIDPTASLRASDLTPAEATISQAKAGDAIVIQLAPGTGSQNYQYKTGYHLVGKFMQPVTPFENKVFKADGQIQIVQTVRTVDGSGTPLTATVDQPWTVNLVGPQVTPKQGELMTQVVGNNGSKTLFQTQPTTIVNYFGFKNNTSISFTNSLHLQVGFDADLAVRGIKTPGVNDVLRPGLTAYQYVIEVVDQQTQQHRFVTGAVKAGQVIVAPTGTTIYKTDLVPDYVEVGATTKLGSDLSNIAKANTGGQTQKEDDDVFEAYGFISDRLNNLTPLPADTTVSTKIAIRSADFNDNQTENAAVDQKVVGIDGLKAAMQAWCHQTNQVYDPTRKDADGTIDMHYNTNSDATTKKIFEPIFYYVLPKYFSYVGGWDAITHKAKDANTGQVVAPKYSTYLVDGRQVVKLDYTGTGFNYVTDGEQSQDQIPIRIDPDAASGTYTYEAFVYTKSGMAQYTTKYDASNLDAQTNAFTQGVVNSGITGTLYKLNYLYGNTFTIKSPVVAYVPTTAQGNQDPKPTIQGTSETKGDQTMYYYVNVANYDVNVIKDGMLLINLPLASDSATSFDFELAGPLSYDSSYDQNFKDGFTYYYATDVQRLPSTKETGVKPSLANYVPADQVTDWTKIKSIIVKFAKDIPAADQIGRFVIKGTDPHFNFDAGKTAYLRVALTGSNFTPFVVTDTGIQIKGQATIKARLHYVDATGADQYVELPMLTKRYTENQATLSPADFAATKVPATAVPANYILSTAAPQLIITNPADQGAAFGKVVQYYFDGDIVQFELVHQTKVETKTFQTTTYYEYDPSASKYQAKGTAEQNSIVVNGQKVAPTTLSYSLRRETDLVTGQATYQIVNNQTNQPVTVDQAGNFTLPGISTLPSLSGYTANTADVVTVRAAQQYNLNTLFTANPDVAALTATQVVHYLPDQQTLTYTMYNKTQNKWITTNPIAFLDGKTDEAATGSGAALTQKVHDFLIPKAYDLDQIYYYNSTTGQFETINYPTDFDVDHDGLVAPGVFSGIPEQNTVILYVKDPVSYTKKKKAVSRTIYYRDADQANETLNHLPLSPLSEDDYPDTIIQSVHFRRFEVVDNITSAILGYYRPSQMELVNGTWQPKAGATYRPFVANDPEVGFEIDTTNGNAATLAAVTNYDLTKLGYTGPVDDNGNAFVKIAAVTPNVASKSTVVNVYYHHQLVAVAPDKLPTAGAKVDPTDANSPVYPKNDYDSAAATTTVQRIIHHVYAAGTQINGGDVSGQAVAGLSDTRQEVTFYQDARLDLVTGAITNTGQFRAVKSATTQAGITTSVPNSDQFTAVTSPAIANYVPVDATVAAAPATVGAAPQTVNVAYVPDNTNVVITYVDADNGGSTITTATLHGPHGSTIVYSTDKTLQDLAAKGYALVTDGYTEDPSSHKYFDKGKPQKWTVVMCHQKLVLDYQHAHASGEEIAAPGYQGKYPQGVTAADLRHRVSRSISFQYANGTTWDGQNLSGQPMRDDKGKELQPLKQTVSYQRQATIDLVKLADPKQAVSAVTYGVWQVTVTPDSNATFAAVDVLPVAGYEADQTTIKAVAPTLDPTAGPQDAKPIVVHYAPLSQEVLVSFVDSEGNVIEPQYKLPGKTGQTVPVADSITPPTGWRLVDPQTGIPSTVTFGREPLPEIKIAIEHATVHLKHDEYHPANTGTLPDNSIRPYPAGVDQADLNRTVTRTIQVHLPDGTIKRTAQVLHFTRGATIDEINGHVTYDSWVAKDGTTMRAVQATDVVATPAGYSPVLSAVELTGVGPDDPDSIVDITYAPNDQHASLIIVDDDAQVNGQPKQLFTTQATGKFGTAIVFNDLKAECDQLTQANYQVDAPGLPTYQATDTNNHFILHVTHKTAPATGSREVREKISYLFVDKRGVEYSIAPDYVTPADARVVFIEHGTLDLVTGIYTWQHDWSAALKQFNAVQSPEVTGYVVQAQRATLPSQTVALDKATERPVMVNDAWHGSLAQTNADQQVQAWTVSYKVYYNAAPQATTVTYVDDDAQGKILVQTKLTGKSFDTVLTKIQNPDPTKYDLVNSAQLPDKIVFTTTGYPAITVHVKHKHAPVQRTVNYERTVAFVDAKGQELAPASTQTLTFTQTGDQDLATRAVTWQPVASQSFARVSAADVPGYTSPQANVAAQKITPTAADFNDAKHTVTVQLVYTANPQTTHVNYVDEKGNPIHTTTVNGQTDQTVEVPSEVPDGWKLVDGQTVPNTITFGPDGRADTPVKIEHQHVTVTPDKPQADGTRLPDNPAKTFSGVEAGDLNKIITRTITVIMPAGKVTTVKQAAKLTRMADVDEVTGEVTYGKWTTGAWDAYAVPRVAGYTPSQTAVDQATVTDTTADTTVEVTYTPNQHQIGVEYVDDDDHGKIVKTAQTDGKTDQTITITPTAPQGYELVNAGNQTYTVTSDDGQTVQIHVKHHRVTTSESKPVTRTINVHTPHDGVKTIKQTAELTRAVTTDQVTGEKAYGDWTTGQWAAYTPEVVAGYMPSTNEVPNVNVDGSSSDQLVDVTYIADTQKVEIIYLDDTKGGSVVKTDQVTGKTDEMVKVTPDVPTGYELVGKVPGDYTMTADGHQTITVHLIHQTKTASESKTITRTINVHTPHDGTKVVKQTATLTRAVTTDQVTGEKVYGDWSTAEWDRYAVPTIAGYVPSIEQVTQQVVNGTTTDQTIDVTYSSGEHTTHVNYVDGDGNTVHTTTITGQTDGTVQVPNETPAGWTVVGEPVPNELTFGPDGHADVTVTVDHQHVTVTPDQPKTPTDKLPDNPTKPYPHGVDHDNLNKIITRTIKITTPDGQTKTVEQTVHLTRTADVDEVTGEITYGKWTTGEWSNYDVPTVPGYTPSQSEVPTTKVTDDTKDQTVTVTYTAVDHTTTISYVDQNGKVIHTTVVTGQTDQTVKVPNEVPTGWTVTGQPAPDTVTFGPDGHNNVTVTIDHQHVTVTPDKPQADGTKLPDNPNQTFRGVAETDLNKIVTRTIEVTTPAGKINTIKQTAKLTRTADVDEVTGEVTYGKWTTGTWSSYTAPNVAGYTPSQAVVAEVTVDADTTNQTVKITYTADSHTTHINYIDKDGKVVHTTTVTGATDQTVKVPNETPAGWTITGDKVPSELTFNADGHVDVTITIDHQHTTVTPDDPKTNGDRLPDNLTKTYPNGVGYDDLNKTVTRTIKVTTPDGQTKTVEQTAKLTRTADVDEVTGAVTYSAWSTGEWPSYVVPSVPGYTPSRAAVASAMVDAATLDQTVMITYAREQAAKGDQLAQPPVVKSTLAGGKPQDVVRLDSAGAHPTDQPARLPQTGDQTNPAGVLGWSILGLLTLLGLKRKRRDEGE
ncbi:mucin-binding protein [Limosilactobacillus ingluviei]